MFRSDSKLVRFLNLAADLICLNFMWLICSLPLVTMGAATAALYRAELKLARGETHVTPGFFRAVRSNFKQATIFHLCSTAALAVMSCSLYLTYTYMETLKYPLTAVIGAGIVVILIMAAYFYPLIAQFDNSFRASLKNAYVLGCTNLPKSILMVLLNLLPILLLVLLPDVFFRVAEIIVLLGFALLAFWNAKIVLGVFKKYFPDAYAEETGE